MKNKILFITLLVFFNTAYISAEQKKSVISDNRGFAGSYQINLDLNYSYNASTVNYKDVLNGPIVAEKTYTPKSFSVYCYNSKGTRKITGNMKNSLRTGAWTSTSNETLNCTIYNGKHEEFTASGNYIEGMPDGEWKFKFKGNCMTYCNITAHFKKGVLSDINYEGKECSNRSPFIVKCKFNSEGFYHGKCTLVQSAIDEYVYDNGKLISYKSTEKGTGRVLKEETYKIEESIYDTTYTVDKDIYEMCLEHYGGDALSDISSTPGLLNMGVWCDGSIKGSDYIVYQGSLGYIDRTIIKAFKYYKRWDIQKVSVGRYFYYINSYLADCLENGIPPYFSPNYSYDKSADIYKANTHIIPTIEQFKKDIASAPKSSDGEYYRINDLFVKIEDGDMERLDKLVNDANTSLAQYEIEVKARKDYEQTRKFIIAESKTFPDLVIETKQGYSGFFISTPDQVVVKEGMQEILDEFNAYNNNYKLHYQDYKFYSESNSKDLLEYKAFIDNAKAFISQKETIDSNNKTIIAESKSYKNLQKVYTSVFSGYDLSWKSNKGTSKLQEVIDFQNGVLNTLKTNASEVNKSIKKVKDINQQKSMIMGK